MRNNDIEFEYNSEDEGYYYVNEKRLENRIYDLISGGIDTNGLNINDDIELDAYLALTSKRTRLLAWYPLDRYNKVLEIGAGFGEITEYLCRHVKHVIAYELKPERARIIKRRCGNNGDLKLYTGKLNEIDFGGKVDLIVVHDVIAFSRKFFKGEEPCVSLFCYLKRFLKPKGRILLSIENRIGLRYFAGAAEDYSRVFYFGLNEFDQDERYRTYSQEELKSIISCSGLIDKEWYYPYPNAVLPEEIFHKDIDSKIYYGVAGEDDGMDAPRYLFFDESRMFMTLHKEGIAYKFANAFIVECETIESKRDEKVVAYVNYSKGITILEDTTNRQFYCNGFVLPEGKRADMAILEQIKRVVDCNMGENNPYIDAFWTLIADIYRVMNRAKVRLEDIYVKGDCISENGSFTLKQPYSIATEFYELYLKHIGRYRNAYRRLKLETLWKVLELSEEEMHYIIDLVDKKNHISRLSYPSILFDFDADADANSVCYNSTGSDCLKQKLYRIHDGLFD